MFYYTYYIYNLTESKRFDAGVLYRSFENVCDHLDNEIQDYCHDRDMVFMKPSWKELRDPEMIYYELKDPNNEYDTYHFIILKMEVID